MQYVPDDVDVEMMGYMNDPLVRRQMGAIINNAGSYGIDLQDPENMGGFFSDFGKKFKDIVSGNTKISVTTDKGSVSAGGGQLTLQQGTAPSTAVAPSSVGIMQYLKNPYIVAGLIGVPLLLVILSKQKKKEESA